jgi:hypothetical protein
MHSVPPRAPARRFPRLRSVSLRVPAGRALALAVDRGRAAVLRRDVALAIVGSVAFAALAGLLTSVSPGLRDWDTYERILFLPVYDIGAGTGDTHVLLHRVGHALTGLGVASRDALLLLDAVGFAALLLAGVYVAWDRGLTGRRLGLAVAALAVASPGIAAMLLMIEDNVLYHAPLLLTFHFLTTAPAPASVEARRGVAAGVCLALAMLTNITALIFLFVLPLSGLLAVLGRRGEALRVAVAPIAALGVYYVAHLTLLAGAPIALHTFLPQALALQDFGPSRTPLLSFERLGELFVGFRAIALRPTLHAMAAPGWLEVALSLVAPVALLAGYVALAARGLHVGRAPADGIGPCVTGAAVLFLALAFPYFYEPILIERWDMFWLVLWLGLVAVLAQPLSRGAAAVLGAVLLLQLGASGLVFANHVGGAFISVEEAATQRTLEEASRDDASTVVLPEDIDRQHLAHLYAHLQDHDVFMVGADGECLQEAFPLRELPRPCDDVAAEVARAPHAVIDGRVPPGWAAAPRAR